MLVIHSVHLGVILVCVAIPSVIKIVNISPIVPVLPPHIDTITHIEKVGHSEAGHVALKGQRKQVYVESPMPGHVLHL